MHKVLKGYLCTESIVLQQALGASIRLFELLDREPKVRDEGQVREAQLKAEVQFNDVYFKYPSRPENEVLKVCCNFNQSGTTWNLNLTTLEVLHLLSMKYHNLWNIFYLNIKPNITFCFLLIFMYQLAIIYII